LYVIYVLRIKSYECHPVIGLFVETPTLAVPIGRNRAGPLLD
jgi:hypothetical protein